MKECNIEKVKEILKSFMISQHDLNDLFIKDNISINVKIDELGEELHEQYNVNDALHDHIEDIYGELSDQDEINSNVASILSIMTERMNDIESRLNKLEKEKRRNATNK